MLGAVTSGRLAVAAVVGVLLGTIAPGCSTSPAQQDAIRQAWAERDAERDRECRRVNGFLVAGSCLPRP
jgi:hypothetical protein